MYHICDPARPEWAIPALHVARSFVQHLLLFGVDAGIIQIILKMDPIHILDQLKRFTLQIVIWRVMLIESCRVM